LRETHERKHSQSWWIGRSAVDVKFGADGALFWHRARDCSIHLHQKLPALHHLFALELDVEVTAGAIIVNQHH